MVTFPETNNTWHLKTHMFGRPDDHHLLSGQFFGLFSRLRPSLLEGLWSWDPMLEMDLICRGLWCLSRLWSKFSPKKNETWWEHEHGTRDKVPYTNFNYLYLWIMLTYTKHVLQVEAAAKSGPDHESVPLFAWIPVPKLNLHYQKTNMAGWKISLFNTLQWTITYHPTKRESRKIIDSKVPAGMGYVSFQEGFSVFWKEYSPGLQGYVSSLEGTCTPKYLWRLESPW